MLTFLLTHEAYGCYGEGASTEVLSAHQYEGKAREAAVAWAKAHADRFSDAIHLLAVTESVA